MCPSEPTTKIWIKIDPYYERRWCSPVTLDSDNIRFMRIFAGVPWRWGVKQQWGNRKRGFSGFRTLRFWHLRKWSQLYYIVLFSPLSPFHWPQNTWPRITLNGLNGHFALNFHYNERPLGNYLLYLFTVESVYTLVYTWPAEKCGKRSSGQWSAEYLESAEKLQIFRRRYIVGTLVNEANIIT